MARQPSELELFRAIVEASDHEAFVGFSKRIRRCVLWVAGKGYRVAPQTEEIVDDVLFGLLQSVDLESFAGGDRSFKAYLYKVVSTVCLRAARRQSRMTSLDSMVALPDGDEKSLHEILGAMVDPALMPGARLEESETRNQVLRALDRIDARCRRLIRGFHLEGTPIPDLAASERARPNTIEVALKRCRERLYTAFLGVYVASADSALRQHVARVARQLPGELAETFKAWWDDGRSPAEIAREYSIDRREALARLSKAKLEVWRLVQELRQLVMPDDGPGFERFSRRLDDEWLRRRVEGPTAVGREDPEEAALTRAFIAADPLGDHEESGSVRRPWMAVLRELLSRWPARVAVAGAACAFLFLGALGARIADLVARPPHVAVNVPKPPWHPDTSARLAIAAGVKPQSERKLHEAQAFYAQADFAARATPLLREAVAADPTNDQAHFWLGVARLLASDDAEAIPALEAAHRLAPRSVLYGQYLAFAHLRHGDVERALQVLGGALGQP